MTRSDLLIEARRNAEFFLMDYADPDEASGEISVTPVDARGLEQAISAHDIYSNVIAYPAAWRTNLQKARELIVGLEPLRARIEFR